MKSKISILLAALALIASSLACAMGEPALENLRSAKDEDGAQPAAVFGENDAIHIVGDLSNAVIGNKIASKWYAVEVEGVEPNFLISETERALEEDMFTGTWTVSADPPWDKGKYKVEVYFNDKLISAVEFTVE